MFVVPLVLILSITINIIILFLLQPSETLSTKNQRKVSFLSVILGILLSTILVYIVIYGVWLSKWVDDPLYGLLDAFALISIAMISSVTTLIWKVFYDQSVFGTKIPIVRMKLLFLLAFGGLLLFAWWQYEIHERDNAAFRQEREKADMEYLENVLKVSLRHDVKIVSHNFDHGYDAYSLSIEVEGNDRWFQNISQTHDMKEQDGRFSFHEEYGRGFINGVCKQHTPIKYVCSFKLFQHQSR